MAEYQIIVEDDCDIVINTVNDAIIVTEIDTSTVVVTPDDSEVTTIEQTTTVIEGDDGSVIVADVGVQGPGSEDDVPFAVRVDFVGETLIYKAQAQPGTLDATNAWRIQEITFVGSDEDTEIRWADGVSDFSKVWDDRLGYTYT